MIETPWAGPGDRDASGRPGGCAAKARAEQAVRALSGESAAVAAHAAIASPRASAGAARTVPARLYIRT